MQEKTVRFNIITTRLKKIYSSIAEISVKTLLTEETVMNSILLFINSGVLDEYIEAICMCPASALSSEKMILLYPEPPVGWEIAVASFASMRNSKNPYSFGELIDYVRKNTYEVMA